MRNDAEFMGRNERETKIPANTVRLPDALTYGNLWALRRIKHSEKNWRISKSKKR